MISRPRQRGQNEELKEVDRQLLLDYPDIALDARRGVAWESEDISGKREYFCLAPRLKHRAVLSDLVLPFGRTFQAFWINAFQPDKYSATSGPNLFRDKIRDLVTGGVHLQRQMDFETSRRPQLNNAVENCLPTPVAREVIISDEVAMRALRISGTNDLFDVVLGSESGFPTLNIDDCTEAAIERASTPASKHPV